MASDRQKAKLQVAKFQTRATSRPAESKTPSMLVNSMRENRETPRPP